MPEIPQWVTEAAERIHAQRFTVRASDGKSALDVRRIALIINERRIKAGGDHIIQSIEELLAMVAEHDAAEKDT